MDINSIYRGVKNTEKKDLEKSIELFLIKKADNGSGVVLYTPEVKGNVQLDLLEFFNKFFHRSEARNKEQEEYDVVVTKTNKQYLTSRSSDFDGIKIFIDKIKNNDFLDDTEGISESEFIAYGIKVMFLDDSYFCYIGEFTSISKVTKMGLIGNLTNNQLKRLNKKNVFGFNPKMSLMIYEDEILISNVRMFEICCDMKKEFIKKSKEVINKINEYGVINNIDQLDITCDGDSRIARRLTKMYSDPERVEAFFSNVDKVDEVLNSKKFKDKFEGIEYRNGKLEYDPKYRQQFITLIADAAYRSVVGGQERIDKSL